MATSLDSKGAFLISYNRGLNLGAKPSGQTKHKPEKDFSFIVIYLWEWIQHPQPLPPGTVLGYNVEEINQPSMTITKKHVWLDFDCCMTASCTCESAVDPFVLFWFFKPFFVTFLLPSLSSLFASIPELRCPELR